MGNGKTHKGGFTLIELALVLAVLSLLVAFAASVAAQHIRRQKAAELQTKMDTIEVALGSFRQRNGRLPCPGDGTLAVSTQYFGVESVNSGACTTGSTYSSGNRTAAASPGPTANFSDTASGTVAGMVPVRTLGLPDDAAFDPWGDAFFYAVDTRITGAAAFTTYLVTDSTIGSIKVMDGSGYPAKTSGQPKTTSAVALIMSFGENGHGAYQFGDGRKSAGSTNSDEQQNAHYSAAGVATTFDNIFVQHPAVTISNNDPLSNFDDVVRYYLRSSFLSTTDTSSQ